MTQQFKFGDKVRHPNFDSPCVFVCQLYDTETKEKTWAIVLNENEYDRGTRFATQQFVTHELLTLIPHPDTVRLNWLENETKIVGNSVNIEYDGSCFYTNEDGCEQENFANLREAIDFLTKLWAAPCNYKPMNGGQILLTTVGIFCIRVVANVMNYLLFGLSILGLAALFGTLVFACVGTIVVWFDGGYR